MAGTINADTLKADSNLKLQIASANVAFIDANGLTIVGNSLNVGGVRIVVSSNNSISTSNVVGANLVTATGTTALGITANGQITTANAPFILTGGQLQFPATQIASGDANCLDDYEEGTWTATLTGSTTAPSSPVTTTGNYTKIGNLVTVFFRFTNVNTTGASGNMYISGLPFTSATSVEQQSAVPMMYGLNITGSYITGYIGQNQTNINFLGIQNNGAWIDVTITAGSAKYMNMSITYRAL
jgi:hypothetical protein